MNIVKILVSTIIVHSMHGNISILPYNSSDEELQFIKKYLPSNPIILETGAFDGTNTLEMSFLWPKGKNYSFEPVPTIYERFLQKTKSAANISSYPYALSDKNGFAEFFLSEISFSPGIHSDSGSLLEPKEHINVDPWVLFKEKTKVQTITLAKWHSDFNVPNIDFMWLDMQGYEIPMLKASVNVLNNTKIVYIEACFLEGYKGQYIYNDYVKWFQENDLTLIARDTQEDHFISPAQWYCNAIFINKKYYKN